MMNFLYVVLVCLLATYVHAVTLEEIARQEGVVRVEQAELDRMRSEYLAEQVAEALERGLQEGGVSIFRASPAENSGLIDPEYVDIDIPYSTWNSSKQRMWRAILAESDVRQQYVSLGRYKVHKESIDKFLGLVRGFVLEDE